MNNKKVFRNGCSVKRERIKKIFYKIVKNVLTNEIKYVIM